MGKRQPTYWNWTSLHCHSAKILLTSLSLFQLVIPRSKLRGIRDQVLKALDNANSIALYSVQPRPDPRNQLDGKYVGSDRELGHIDISGEQGKQIIRKFKAAIASGADQPADRSLWCKPHHIFRVVSDKNTYDLMPCSQKTLKIESRGTVGYLNVMGEGLAQELDALLDKAKIPLAPY